MQKALRADPDPNVHMGDGTHCGPPGTVEAQGRVDDRKNSKDIQPLATDWDATT